jgi:MarR family transcriptional regulator, organic hydroperoxide resistance regulator
MANRFSRSTPGSKGRQERSKRALDTFRRIVSMAKRHFVHVRTQCDLSGAELWALWQVKQHSGLTVQELANSLSVHRSTASNLAEKLFSGGFVRKRRDTVDRRVVRLFITALGNQILRDAPTDAQGAVPDALNRMSDKELKAVEEALLVLARKIGLDKSSSTE